MAGGLLTLPSGVLDSTGVPCASFVTANVRVKTSTGTVAIATDVLTFPGPSTVGNWIVPNSRVLVNSIPSIGQGCVGQAIIPGTPPVPGPTSIVMTDPRASGS
jgi:hypothetical protein